MDKIRLEKLGKHLSKLLGDIIRKDVGDTALGGLVSVTKTILNPVNDRADVHVSIFAPGDTEIETVFKNLVKHCSFIRGKLGKALHLKTVPTLFFVMDTSIEYSQHISNIIADIKSKTVDEENVEE